MLVTEAALLEKKYAGYDDKVYEEARGGIINSYLLNFAMKEMLLIRDHLLENKLDRIIER